MKYILWLLVFLGISQAQEYRSVFDCSASDARYISSRMALIEKTMDMIEKQGDTTKFALTLHGDCVAMVSKSYDEITDDTDLIYIKKARDSISRLAKQKDVNIVVCAMSLNANGIEQEDVLPFISISNNSFIDTIGYQNRGYALMTFK